MKATAALLAVAAAASAQTLVNGGFDGTLSPWVQPAGGFVSTTTFASNGGPTQDVAQTNSVTPVTLSQGVDGFKVGSTYSLSADVIFQGTANGGSNVNLQVEGQGIAPFQIGEVQGGSVGRISGNFVAQAADLSIVFTAVNKAGLTSSVNIENVSLNQVATASGVRTRRAIREKRAARIARERS